MDRKTWTTWAISILAFLSVFLLIGLLFFAFRQLSTDDSVPCTTLACNDIAYQLLHRMDQNVNPCDDFYQFACGGFVNSTNDKYDIKKKQRFETLEKLENILEQSISDDDPEYLKFAKNLYRKCTVLQLNNQFNSHSFLNFIEIFEYWPVLRSQWSESEFNFNKTVFKVGNTTEWINYFFYFDLNIDDYSSIEVYPFPYKLTRDQLNQGLNNSDVKNYYDKMTNLSASFYSDASSNIKIVKMINEILKFETDILNMTLLPKNKMSNGTLKNVKMTLEELKNNYNYFDWEEYINYLLGSPVNKTTTKIIIKDIDYLNNLKYLINSTEKIIQSNYIRWKHYQKKYDILDYSIHRNCSIVTIEKLPIAMGAVYYQNYGDNNFRDDVLQIILDIKKQYSDMINNPNWVDDMTKKKAIEKLESLKYFIEYPKEFLNNSIIDEFYGRLKFFDRDNIVDQSIRIDIFNRKYLLTQNNDESFWTFWGKNMLDYNAYYNKKKNILVLPPVYQNFLFKKNNLNSINYGSIGFTIGHEIGHAFDNVGTLYDANGIYNNWWTDDSGKKFDDRAMCMVEQYNNYTLPEINANLDGMKSIGENIADNSGLKAAYRGYIKKLKSSSNGETLPGLSYNSKQLFWISYASGWCEKVTDESLKRDLLDEHAPNKFRVIGPLSNIQEFSNDFQCPIGSNMNPIKKCTVW